MGLLRVGLAIALMIAVCMVVGCGGDASAPVVSKVSMLFIDTTNSQNGLWRWMDRTAKEVGGRAVQTQEPAAIRREIGRVTEPGLIYMIGGYWQDSVDLGARYASMSEIIQTINSQHVWVVDGLRGDGIASYLIDNGAPLVMAAATRDHYVVGIASTDPPRPEEEGPFFGRLLFNHLAAGESIEESWLAVAGDVTLPLMERYEQGAELAWVMGWKDVGYPTHVIYPEPAIWGQDSPLFQWRPVQPQPAN